jgi:protein TonB
VKEVDALSGPPDLVPAATDAVKQWRYQPTLLNGDPIEVDTTVSVSFAN